MHSRHIGLIRKAMNGTVRVLLPREHGAYVELGFPVLSALTIVAPTASAAALAAAATSFFLAHESLAVLSGLRGRRVRDASHLQARVGFMTLASLGLLMGVAGFVLAVPAARVATVVPIGGAAFLLPWVLRQAQKSLPAELLVVGVFATLVLPIGIASGMAWSLAWIVSAVWMASFVPGTITVHALKLHHKGRRSAAGMRVAACGTAFAAVAGAAAAAQWEVIPVPAAVAVVPPTAAAAWLSLRPVHPRNLKRVGWAFVGANLVTWLCLLLL